MFDLQFNNVEKRFYNWRQLYCSIWLIYSSGQQQWSSYLNSLEYKKQCMIDRRQQACEICIIFFIFYWCCEYLLFVVLKDIFIFIHTQVLRNEVNNDMIGWSTKILVLLTKRNQFPTLSFVKFLVCQHWEFLTRYSDIHIYRVVGRDFRMWITK